MNRIKEVLKEQGRTQVWLAGKIGKSQGTIALYVNNKLQPTLDTLFRIAEHLDVNPKKLIINTSKSKKLIK
jgi:transcriptional regulator with XRE-family HTH domain